MDSNLYKGRKGQKRLKEINAKTDQFFSRTDQRYMETEEMKAILDRLRDPLVRLYFARAFHHLDSSWQGTRTPGLLRLCRRWINAKNVAELTRETIDAMLQDILPSARMQDLREAMQAPQE